MLRLAASFTGTFGLVRVAEGAEAGTLLGSWLKGNSKTSTHQTKLAVFMAPIQPGTHAILRANIYCRKDKPRRFPQPNFLGFLGFLLMRLVGNELDGRLWSPQRNPPRGWFISRSHAPFNSHSLQISGTRMSSYLPLASKSSTR